MKQLIYWIFHKARTFRVNILTVFLSLLTISFLCVISFTYSRHHQSILDFSRGVAKRVVTLIVVKLNAIVEGSERVVEIAAGYLPEIGELSFDNQKLTSFLLSVVKNDQNFSNFYVGLPNGTFIGAFNHSFTAQKYYITDPEKPLPSDTAFALRYINLSVEPYQEETYYLNAAFETVGSEANSASSFDARQRQWFIGAVNTKGLFWTNFYTYYVTLDTGISIANPVYNDKGELLCVVAADLSFLFLSQFVEQQRIGNTGRAFILSESGEIYVPVVQHSHHNSEYHSKEIVDQVFKNYENGDKADSDFIVEFDDVKYLTYIRNLPVFFNKHWMIVTVAPLSDFFGQIFQTQKQLVMIIIGILIVATLIIIYFAKRISSPIVILASEVNKIRNLDLSSEKRVHTNIKEVFLIDNSIAAMRHVIRSFSKYVPKEIVSNLFKKTDDIAQGGEIKELTIFFSDIADFTMIAETHSIDVLNPLLTEYFGAMTKIILESQGTIDKFLSDGIMSFWGAPVEFDDHASKACIAALRCTAMLTALNRKRREEGKPEFLTRFGINTGIVIVGNIGTEDRINYTVIGDAVNTTYRLLKVDKDYHTSILVSEDAKKHLSTDFVLRPLDVVEVTGRKEKIKVYELCGNLAELEILPTKEQISLCEEFTVAYEAMDRKDLKQARVLFSAIAAKFPEDYPTKIYLKRLEEEHP